MNTQSNMKADEIIKILKKNDLLPFFFECEKGYLSDIEYETLDDGKITSMEEETSFLTTLGLANYQSKGGRSDTSEFWNVVYFPDYDVYLKISGEYDSYGQYDHSYDEVEEVRPKEVTETIYE